ncbi:hypothetical protein SADUNF_Sadunf16G0252900 [Salix dunnii]|uniref:Uncharacterized protein n=1 Tax=Salix dunnii TaxID=1413687 RepID=A0A835JGA8_9ROSI|nr:hypothetical protein SADUNF_Sadunf16G0252900 [Salix dunnii]
MIDKLQKPKVFQLRFGTFCSIMNRYDIIVVNVFYNIIDVEPPQQHVEPKLHDIDNPFIQEVVASASKKPLLLNPITPTHIPSSRSHVHTPSRSTTNATVRPPNIFTLLDDNASTMSKEKDPPKK